jgi:hypothetical protein
MWKFYGRILRSALFEFWSVTDKAIAAAAVALFFIGIFNRKWADKVVTAWNGISPWWSLVPIAILVAYRLLRANYEKFAALEQALAVRHTGEQLCARLGELYAEAAELRLEKIDSDSELQAWIVSFNDWRECTLDALATFGLPAEYALFQNADASGARMPLPVMSHWMDEVRRYDAIFNKYQVELHHILERRSNLSV